MRGVIGTSHWTLRVPVRKADRKLGLSTGSRSVWKGPEWKAGHVHLWEELEEEERPAKGDGSGVAGPGE